jgi:hypothetical protein
VVVRTKTVHRNLSDKANRVRNPKSQTRVTNLDKVRWVARVASRDSLVSRAAEEIRVPNQAEQTPAVQVLTETGNRMFPALKTTIQIWTRIWIQTLTGHVPTDHQTDLLVEEACDCSINCLKEKSSGLHSFEDFFFGSLEKMGKCGPDKFAFRQRTDQFNIVGYGSFVIKEFKHFMHFIVAKHL